MAKITIKASSYAELIEMVSQYFHFNRRVEFVGDHSNVKLKENGFTARK